MKYFQLYYQISRFTIKWNSHGRTCWQTSEGNHRGNVSSIGSVWNGICNLTHICLFANAWNITYFSIYGFLLAITNSTGIREMYDDLFLCDVQRCWENMSHIAQKPVAQNCAGKLSSHTMWNENVMSTKVKQHLIYDCLLMIACLEKQSVADWWADQNEQHIITD